MDNNKRKDHDNVKIQLHKHSFEWASLNSELPQDLTMQFKQKVNKIDNYEVICSNVKLISKQEDLYNLIKALSNLIKAIYYSIKYRIDFSCGYKYRKYECECYDPPSADNDSSSHDPMIITVEMIGNIICKSENLKSIRYQIYGKKVSPIKIVANRIVDMGSTEDDKDAVDIVFNKITLRYKIILKTVQVLIQLIVVSFIVLCIVVVNKYKLYETVSNNTSIVKDILYLSVIVFIGFIWPRTIYKKFIAKYIKIPAFFK